MSDHRPGPAPLDIDEANRLVEATSRVTVVDAETEGPVSLSNARLDEVDEEPSSDPLVPTGRDDCDRQLRDILRDEAIAVARLGVGPIPSRTQRFILNGDESVVAFPRPSSELHRIARIGEHFVTARRGLVGSPDCGLAEHRRQKGEVLSPRRATSNLLHAVSQAVPRVA